MPEREALSHRGRHRRRRPVPRLRHRDIAVPRHPGRRREPRHRNAVLLRHHGAAEGHPPADARGASRRAAPAVGVPRQPVALPRGDDLSLAGAAVPLGTAGRGGSHHPQGRDGDRDGALRPRGVPRARGAPPCHAQPARAHDVQPDAEAPRRGAHPVRPLVARSSTSTTAPPRGSGSPRATPRSGSPTGGPWAGPCSGTSTCSTTR